MKQILLSALIATMSITGAASAMAQDGMGKGQNMPKFSDCDLDGNGAIDSDEFYEARSKRMAEQAAKGGKMKNAANAPSFEDIDTNADGNVSPEEFSAHQAEHMKKHQGKQSG